MKKNFLAICAGIFISLVIFSAGEVFFRFNEDYHWLQPIKFKHPKGVTMDEAASEKLYELIKDQEVLGWKPLLTREEGKKIKSEGQDKVEIGGRVPCCIFHNPAPEAQQFRVEARSKVTKTLIAVSHYNLDAYGRRATPLVKNPRENILMFGDSYTLGEVVDDKYTAPNQLARLRPDTQVVNFGLSGGSPNEFLYELQNDSGQRLHGIQNVPTKVLYTYIDHHLERLICRSQCLRPGHDWLKDRPYYRFEDGHVVFKGFFDTDRPIRNALYHLINSSAFLRFFDVIWPVRFDHSDFDFFAQVMLTAKTKASTLFKDVDFYVVLYPGASEVYGRQIREACEKLGLKVIDYSSINVGTATKQNHEIPGDGHPSPLTQYLFATLLNQDLPK